MQDGVPANFYEKKEGRSQSVLSSVVGTDSDLTDLNLN